MNDQSGWDEGPSGAGCGEYGGDVGRRATLERDRRGDRVRGEDDRRRLHRGGHPAEERQEAGQEATVAARAESPRLDAALVRQAVDLHVALAHALASSLAAAAVVALYSEEAVEVVVGSDGVLLAVVQSRLSATALFDI